MADLKIIQSVRSLRRTRKALREARAQSTEPADVGPLMQFVPKLFGWAGYRYLEPRHIPKLVDWLDRAPHGGLRAVAAMPPRHAKTDTVSAAIVKWLRKDPWLRVMYLSYGSNLAEDKNQQIMMLAELAGVAISRTARSKRNWMTPQGGGVRAAGLDGPITGHGADVIIVDDPHKNRADAESGPMRDRTWSYYTGVAENRLEPDGSVLIMQQRWHPDDVAGRALKLEDFEHIHYPALWKDEAGQERALWEQRWPLEALKKRRRIIGAYDFASQYMGSPTPRGGNSFAAPILVRRPPKTRNIVHTVIGVDLTHTGRTSRDWSVAVVMVRDRRGLCTVIDVVRSQKRLGVTRRRGKIVELGFSSDIARLQRAYPKAETVMRIGATEDVMLELMGQLEKDPVDIEPVKATTDKWVNNQAYATAWNDERVRVLADRSWTDDFNTEHRDFTGKPNHQDDQVDAAGTAYDRLMLEDAEELEAYDERVTASLRKRRWT